MKPTEPTLLPRVLLGAATGAAALLGAAASASATPVAFDPADVTVGTGGTGTGSIYFDPQTGYAGLTQAEGTSGLNANFLLTFNGSATKPYYYNASGSSQTSQTVSIGTTVYTPRLALGASVNSGTGTYGSGSATYLNLNNNTTTAQWTTGTRGYLALGITANAATGTVPTGTQLYGWAEVSYNADNSLTLYRLGYDNAGGTSLAGAVPEPGSLAAAATLGAAGLLTYRRRRAAGPATGDAQA